MESEDTRLSPRCTQCGADLEFREGEIFVACAHCTSALYLDQSGVVFHYHLARTLDAKSAKDTLKRWMSGAKTAKDLDRLAEIEQPVLRYFPIWRFRVREGRAEGVYVEPAAVTTLGLLDGITVPLGELRHYDPKLAAYLVRPTVSHRTAARGRKLQEAALVHVPLFFFRFHYQGQAYQAAVDGSTGQVFSETYPRRWDLPYRITTAAAFGVFTLVGLATYLLVSPGSDELGLPYVVRRIGVQLLAAALLFLLARQVAQKV